MDNLSNVEITNPIILTVKEWAEERNIIDINKTIRLNKNNYPYITFIDNTNDSVNIYFSKAQTLKLLQYDANGELILDEEGVALFQEGMSKVNKGFFNNRMMTLATNKQDKERWKISSKSEDRVSLESLF